MISWRNVWRNRGVIVHLAYGQPEGPQRLAMRALLNGRLTGESITLQLSSVSVEKRWVSVVCEILFHAKVET